MTIQVPSRYAHRFTADDCRLADLEAIVAESTRITDYPYADAVVEDVLIYDSAALRGSATDDRERYSVMAELSRAIGIGPGVVVLKGAFDDLTVVDRATDAFNRIGAAERAAGAGTGDHFAAAGSNMRIWNALEKLAIEDPGVFVDYYSNDMLALVSEAWLGPNYQVTSQVNQVNPGGKAQVPHRDYHLGFQSQEAAVAYPVHAHAMSAALTLQVVVAHCDMPVESGPTMLLPHSQKYLPGYVAWHMREFIEHFASNHVQLPLAKGDAVFLSPALHHAAGENASTGISRTANLLQVSSPFGRAMESIDRHRMSMATFPALIEAKRSGMADRHLHNAIAAIAEGYPFPTNLDRDQPQGSDAPPAQTAILHAAVDAAWDSARLAAALKEYDVNHRSW